MAVRITKNADTLALLYEIEKEVEKFKKLNAKATAYLDRAKEVKDDIFTRLDSISKEDFALYSEKIKRITNRLK